MLHRSNSPDSVLVLCPMRVEHRAVLAAVRVAKVGGVRVIQTGVGKRAVLRTLEREAAVERPSFAVLAGACGGLVPCEDVPSISRVIDGHGNSWTPPICAPGGATLIGVDEIVATPEDKRALAARTGATIVDMEAHAFAEACGRLEIPWAVVRGVSDTPDQTLPAEVIGWITPEGGTRGARALLDMALRPGLIPHVIGVLRRANRVLPRVGEEVVRIVRARNAVTVRLNELSEPRPPSSGKGRAIGVRQ